MTRITIKATLSRKKLGTDGLRGRDKRCQQWQQALPLRISFMLLCHLEIRHPASSSVTNSEDTRPCASTQIHHKVSESSERCRALRWA